MAAIPTCRLLRPAAKPKNSGHVWRLVMMWPPRKSEALAKIEAKKNAYTVAELAEEYFEKTILGRWKHPNIVRSRIEKDIKPNIGKIPVEDGFVA